MDCNWESCQRRKTVGVTWESLSSSLITEDDVCYMYIVMDWYIDSDCGGSCCAVRSLQQEENVAETAIRVHVNDGNERERERIAMKWEEARGACSRSDCSYFDVKQLLDALKRE